MSKGRYIYTAILLVCGTSFKAQAQNYSIDVLQGGVNDFVCSIAYDSLGNNLYVTGWLTQAGGINTYKIAKYDGLQWDSLNNNFECDGFCADNRVVFYQNKLIAAGVATKVNGSWKGGLLTFNDTTKEWDVFSQYHNGTSVMSMKTIDTSLYLFGIIDTIAGQLTNLAARYDGQQWHGINPTNKIDNRTYCGMVYNGELYVGGNFWGLTQPGLDKIAKYDAVLNQWVTVGGGFPGGLDHVDDMVVYNGKLIVAGGFSAASNPACNCNGIAAWDGTNWDNMGLPFPVNTILSPLVVYNNKLFTTGYIPNGTGLYWTSMVVYDGIQWTIHPIELYANGYRLPPVSFATGDNKLFMSGSFTLADSMSCGRVISYTETVGIAEHFNTGHGMMVFPNPVYEELKIAINDEVFLQHGVDLYVYNVTGHLVLYKKINSTVQSVSVTALEQGLYVIQLKEKNGVMHHSKFVKQ